MTILGMAATTILPGAVGSVSVKAALSIMDDELLFPKTMVSVEVPFVGITAGENCLLTVGGVVTINCALVGSPLVTPS